METFPVAKGTTSRVFARFWIFAITIAIGMSGCSHRNQSTAPVSDDGSDIGDDGSGSGGGESMEVTVGGTISGLNGSVVLQNNLDDDLTLNADGAFAFATALAEGSTYSVTVLTQPQGQICSIANGAGLTAGSAIVSVTVVCSAITHTVGGNISGLSGTLVLRNNDTDDLTVEANGSFTFGTPLAQGATYAISVQANPATQTCSIESETDHGTIADTDVTTVNVVCVENSYSIGGTVSGLESGKTVVLQNNDADHTIEVTGNTSFAFAGQTSGTAYAVTVTTQPIGQTCIPAHNTGTVAGSYISDIVVACSDNPSHALQVTVVNLGANQSLTLHNSVTNEDKTVGANGGVAFAAPIREGIAYTVAVTVQPTRQVCEVAHGQGTMGNSDVSNVVVTCVTQSPRIFASSVTGSQDLKTRGGASTGVAGADVLCMQDPNKPSEGTYKALIVDGIVRRACTTANCVNASQEHIDWVLQPVTTYYRTDGNTQLFTTNTRGIFEFGNFDNPFWSGGPDYFWSGFQYHSWITDPNTAAGWTDERWGGGCGYLHVTDAGAIAAAACGGGGPGLHLVCVEQ